MRKRLLFAVQPAGRYEENLIDDNQLILGEKKPVHNNLLTLFPEAAPVAVLRRPTYWDEKRTNENDDIQNPVERARELDTFKRHESFDNYKKIFYKPTRFACEGFTYEYKGMNLVNVGRAFMGGTKPMYYFEDRNAPVTDATGRVTGYKIYLYKEGVNCIGRKTPDRALITEAASKLQNIVCGPYYIKAFAVRNEAGEPIGTFQEMINQKPKAERVDLFSWQANPDNSLSDDVKNEVLREHILDWLLCNFDTKGENFLHRNADGHLSSIDKEASFYFLEKQEAQNMSYTYRPHSNDTIYNTIFQEYIKGTLELNFQPMLDKARQIAAMDDDEYLAIFNEWINKKYDGDEKRQEIRDKILGRKNNLLAQYNTFFNSLREAREQRRNNINQP